MCSVDSDQSLFELVDEVGVLWKELAIDVGFRSHEIDRIENEARTPKEQAYKMLRHLQSRKGHSDFNVDQVRARIRKIKRKQYDAQLKRNIWDYPTSCCFNIKGIIFLDLVFPENVHDDKNLCGREEELSGIFQQFWHDLATEEEIPQFCLQAH